MRENESSVLDIDGWRFAEMTPAAAATVLDWHYEGEYAFYDMAADPGDAAEFVDRERWRLRDLERDREVLLQVQDRAGSLAGFYSFQGSVDLCTVGLGLAPESTGGGVGEGFVRAGLRFAFDQWAVCRFRLEVAAFNVRAIKVYERVGFRETSRFLRNLGGRDVPFVEMTLEGFGQSDVRRL